MQELMVKLSNYSAKHMRAEPWGLVRMDHGSIMIHLTPGEVTVCFCFFSFKYQLDTKVPAISNSLLNANKFCMEKSSQNTLLNNSFCVPWRLDGYMALELNEDEKIVFEMLKCVFNPVKNIYLKLYCELSNSFNYKRNNFFF